MFPRHPHAKPHGLQQGNINFPGVAKVPAKVNDHRHPVSKPMTQARRETLHQMKQHGDRQAVKSRLASFVFQKLVNHFGEAHKKTIMSCVEAFFDVKSSFTSEDIVGLEMVIAESIRSNHKPSRAAQQQPQQQQYMFPSATQRPSPAQHEQDQPRRAQPSDEWQAMQVWEGWRAWM